MFRLNITSYWFSSHQLVKNSFEYFMFNFKLSYIFQLLVLWVPFKTTYELLNLGALKFSAVDKIYIFQCMGKIFCVEFQRYPLKFHTKYLTHTLKDMFFIQRRNLRALRFKSSYTFLKRPPVHIVRLEPGQHYHQTSNIRCTKSQNLNVPRLILQLSLPNPWKPGVKSRMKM